MRDFDEAMDKMVLGVRHTGLLNEEERRVVAYHEAGHTIVAAFTPGADPVNKVTIIPRGRTLGATEQLPEADRHNYTKDYLMGKLTVMLGGRAADEMVTGQPTTGAEEDLRQAANLARRMVGLWGMSDDIGPVSYGLGETHPFLGREIGKPREYADATAAQLDAAVRKLIEEARQRAKVLLEKHRTALDALAEDLVVHETVEAKQLESLLRRYDRTA
jgi:cell division protease FtsH